MGLLGILVGLGLLIALAYRGWSVLLLAPAAALVAAAFGGQPLLASWTQLFMTSAAEFLAQFFPIFFLGGRRLHHSFSRREPGHSCRRARGCLGDVWRRQPVRRLLRDCSDGAVAV